METTKWVLTVATFHLLSNDDVRAKLKSELAEAMPDSSNILPYIELEKLAFLTAVIQECKSAFN
jgi:cytochrome P450